MAKRCCAVCGEKIGHGRLYVNTADRMFICNQCYRDSGIPTFVSGMQFVTDKSSEEIRTIIVKNREEGKVADAFSPDTRISIYIKSDTKNGFFQVPQHNRNAIFRTDDIISYEVIEDTERVKKGGVGRAVAGGILFGGVGAIVGATTAKQKKVIEKLDVKINVKNSFGNPELITIPIVHKPMVVGSMGLNIRLQELEKIVKFLDKYAKHEDVPSDTPNIDPIDVIRRYKFLLDDGIITQEEFEKKKKELLGI